jgi:hypothetical protein
MGPVGADPPSRQPFSLGAGRAAFARLMARRGQDDDENWRTSSCQRAKGESLE